jgi:putative flippase GtrA
MKYLMKLPVFVRYLLSTIINTGVNVGTYMLLLSAGASVIVANIVSVCAEIPVSFVLKDLFVFPNENQKLWLKFGKFVASRAFAIGLELVLVPILCLVLNEVVSKWVAQGCVFVVNYLVSKYLVFK